MTSVKFASGINSFAFELSRQPQAHSTRYCRGSIVSIAITILCVTISSIEAKAHIVSFAIVGPEVSGGPISVDLYDFDEAQQNLVATQYFPVTGRFIRVIDIEYDPFTGDLYTLVAGEEGLGGLFRRTPEGVSTKVANASSSGSFPGGNLAISTIPELSPFVILGGTCAMIFGAATYVRRTSRTTDEVS